MSRHTRPWRAVLRSALIVVITIACGVAVYSEWSTLAPGLRGLRHLEWRWYAVAGVAELLSMVGLAFLQRTILDAQGARLGVARILASGYTANALAVGIPVIGQGLAGRQAYLRFRAGGADATAASLTLTVSGVVSTIALTTVIAPAGVLSGNPAAALGGFLVAIGCLGPAVFVLVEVRSVRGQVHLRRIIHPPIRWCRRWLRRPRGEVEVLAQSVVDALTQVRLGAATLAAASGWALLNWWADVACLAFSLRAAGITDVSFGAILLVWTAGTGAGTLSPTPAGIGVVEIAMIASLRAAGADSVLAVTAVVLYRVISLKGAVTVWALYYHWREARRQSPAAIPSGGDGRPPPSREVDRRRAPNQEGDH